MKKFKLFSLLVLLLIGISASSQTIGFAGQLSYSKAKGDVFKDPNGNEFFSIGLGYEADLMLYPDFMDEKLGFGITYFGSFLFGQTGDGDFDLAMYGLSLYGFKGQLRLFDSEAKVCPYISLGLGLSHFETPAWVSGDDVIVHADNAFSLGIRPEIGIELSGVIISASYFVPMKYDVANLARDFKGTAGAFSIGIGYRTFLYL
jgi:hypothetical protein